MNILLLILLVILIFGALPVFPYSRGWGYTPVGAIILIVLILLLCGVRF